MRFLRTNTAVRVTVGPFFDKTDGVTPETALTVTSCKLTFMVDDGNVPTLVLDTNPTASGGANDMVHVTGDDAGFYDLELAAANVNYLGRAMLAITDAATHCPVFHEFMILPAVVYDAMVLGTDLFDVSVTQFAGSAITSASGIPEVKVASIANNALTAAAINADAITAAKVAADVTTEIQSGLATAAELAKVPKSDGTATWNATALASIQSEANDALVAYDPPTRAEATSDVNSVLTVLGTPDGASVSADIATVNGLINGLPFDTITGALEGLVPVSTTVVGGTGNDTTHVHLSTLTYGDDEINSMLLVILDASTSEYHSRWIEDWVASTKLATVATLPFTPTAGDFDSYWLLPIRADVTGGSGLDAAGVRAAIGLASANLDTQLGTIDTNVDSILVDTAEIGAAGAGLTEAGGTGDQLSAIPWNAAWDAEVQSEADDALVAKGLDHLVAASVTGTDITDNSIIAKIVSKSATADWDSFDNTSDSLEANRDNIGTAGAGLTAADDSVMTRLGSPAGASVSADIAAVKSDSAAILTDTGTTLDGKIDTIDTVVDAIKAKTDLIPAAPAAVGDIPTAVQNADALLGRNIAGGSSTGRTVKQALRALRNKVTRSGGTITVFQEDDTTSDWTASYTTDDTAEPIVTVDPS